MTDAKPRVLRSLALFAGAAACLLVFVVTAGLAISGDSQAFDEAVVLGLRSSADPAIPIGPHWLLRFAREMTALAGTPILTVATLILTGWFVVRREWALAGLLLAAVIGETLLSSGLKSLFDRPRPDLVPHLVHASGNSFPSGHATSAAAIYLIFAAMIAQRVNDAATRRYLFFVAVILAAIVGASRVYLGVHYPTDVIGGLSFGAAWAAILWIAAERWSR